MEGEDFKIQSDELARFPKTVWCFNSDYARFKDGTLAAYRHDEFPAKLYAMIQIYARWLNIFSAQKPLQPVAAQMADEIADIRRTFK